MNMVGWREITNGYGETCLVIMDHGIHAVCLPNLLLKDFVCRVDGFPNHHHHETLAMLWPITLIQARRITTLWTKWKRKNWPWIQDLVSSMVPLGFGLQSWFPNHHHHRTFVMLWEITLIPRRRIRTHGELNGREKNCPWIESFFDSAFGDKQANKCPHPNDCRGESQCWQLLSFAFCWYHHKLLNSKSETSKLS